MESTDWKARLAATVGAATLEAEQELSGTQPRKFDNFLERILRTWSKFYAHDGNLEPEYRSSEGRVFPLPSLLIPLEKIAQLVRLPHSPEDWSAPCFETVNGRTYVRLFLHPADRPHFRSLLESGEKDPRRWLATPTSSHRSLFVIDPDRPEGAPLVIKVSLRRRMMGFTRVVTPKHVARSVAMTAFVRDAHVRSGGRLPSGVCWEFMPEPVALMPPGLEEGGLILRRFPEPIDPTRTALIPFYALLSFRRQGRWIDRLHEADGTRPPAEFLCEKIVLPLLELYQQLALDYGISAELHKQNVGLLVDPLEDRIRGFYLRDMDGLTLDLPYRRRLGLPEPFTLPPWARGLDDVLRSDAAQLTQAFNYFFLGAMNVDQLAKGFLPRREAYALIRKLDQTHLTEIHRRFGTRLRSLSDLSDFWDQFHREITPPADYARVSDKRRRSVRRYGFLRRFELWMGERFRI